MVQLNLRVTVATAVVAVAVVVAVVVVAFVVDAVVRGSEPIPGFCHAIVIF